MHIIDMHCDTMLQCYLQPDMGLKKNAWHVDIEKLKAGGCLAQFFALFLTSNESAIEDGVELAPYPLFQALYEVYETQIEENRDAIRKALNINDLLRNKQEGKMSAFLAVEDSVFLEGNMERLEEAFRKGVRLITLTWNYENSVGYPCSPDNQAHQKGLKPFGFEVVERMNQLGMIVDVSHLSEGGFYDVARHSTRPFIASHSCARALCNHQRNLTDQQLHILGEKGGAVGMNFCPRFVKQGGGSIFVADIAEHIVHMVGKAGIEAVGLGSDFDGIEGQLEISDYSRFDLLVEALRRHFSDDAVDKICGGNMQRIIKECL